MVFIDSLERFNLIGRKECLVLLDEQFMTGGGQERA